MAARRGKSQARRNSNQGTPGWVWLVAGVAIAAVVFLAAPNLFKNDGDGFLRVGPQPDPNAQPAPVSDADTDVGTELPKPGAAKPAEPAKPAATQYDFYTLLPGKEVEMSDAELAASARAEDQRRAKAEAQRAQAALEGRPLPPAPADNARYILQAGAFGASGDAEATKAKLAMMGLAARVESAQINGKTVYRVRMGPYGSAGELSEAKQKLDGTGLQAMAIKAQ